MLFTFWVVILYSILFPNGSSGDSANITTSLVEEDPWNSPDELLNKTTLIGHGEDGVPISSGSCDYSMYNGEGNFSTFGYPEHYENDVDCTYRIKRVDDSCHLEVVFHDFHLQKDSNGQCPHDYLTINKRRYCGDIWRGRTETVDFPPDLKETIFYFHTDGSITKRGFWIEVIRKPGSCNLVDSHLSTSFCDKVIKEKDFELATPNFPDDYGNRYSCFYTVERTSDDVCGLELTFIKFDLEPSDDCSYDFLEISQKRLCGTITSGSVRVFMFTEPSLLLQFRSDDQNTRPGFHIRARQITECYPSQPVYIPQTCNEWTTAISSIITSQDYPDNAPSNITCIYNVGRHDDRYCGLQVTVDDFDVEFSPNCTAAYLVIGEEKYCGKALTGETRNLQFDFLKRVSFVFHTDNDYSQSRFKLTFQQTGCGRLDSSVAEDRPVECDETYSEGNFSIKSPNFPDDYTNSLDCRFLIRRLGNHICHLEFTFISFDVENGPDCDNDYLEIDTHRLCGTLEADLKKTYPFPGKEKAVHFHTDMSTTRPGFFIRVTQVPCTHEPGDQPSRLPTSPSQECGEKFRGRSFDLRSPGYPGDYENNLNCEYSIIPFNSAICRLLLRFVDFSLEQSEVCEKDFLKVGDERMCGEIDSDTMRTYDFTGPNPFRLHFSSDGNETERGFHIQGFQQECPPSTSPRPLEERPCEQVISGVEAVMRSPNFPEPYDNNQDCRYVIQRHNKLICKLELVLRRLHIQPGDSCQFDYLEVASHRFCGSTTRKTKRSFPFEGDKMDIVFHSDDSVQDRGFEIEVLQKECDPATSAPAIEASENCNEVFMERDTTIRSPQHPEDYSNSLDCKYVIRRAGDDICKLSMFFVSFDVESSSDCEYDYLEIDGEKLCGVMTNATRTYDFRDYEKTLTFHTDSGTSRPGFNIRVTQKECEAMTVRPQPFPLKPCNQEFSGETFEIRSENHPSHYDTNLNCVYTIHRYNDAICHLEVTFVTFDLEASANCQYDYLEMDGEKLCGVFPANMKRVVKFTTPVKTFHFRSDGATSRPGFILKVKQVPCDFLPPGDTSIPLLPRPPQPPIPVPPESCDKTFTSISGTLSSFGFPDNYPNNLHCTYVFIGQPGYCRVIFAFANFHIETSSDLCPEDYLEVSGVRYCGRQLEGSTRSVAFYGSPREVKLNFHSDRQGSDLGFRASFHQLPCPSSPSFRPTILPQPLQPEQPQRTCDRLYASVEFEILSPEHPNNYPNKKSCRYTIRRLSDRICTLRLIFTTFEVESSKNCEYDFLEVEGSKLCGTLPADHVQDYDLRNFQTTLIFHSDPANSRPGFRIKAQQVECGANSFGTAASQPYPQQNPQVSKPNVAGGYPYPQRPPQNPFPPGPYPPPQGYPYPNKQPSPPVNPSYPPQGGYPTKGAPPSGTPHFPPQGYPYPPKQPSPPAGPHYPPQGSPYPPKQLPPQAGHHYPPQGSPYPPKQPSPPAGPPYPPQGYPYPSKQQPSPPAGPPYPPQGQPYPPKQQPSPPYPPQGYPYPPKQQPSPPAGPPYPPQGQPYPPKQPYPPSQPHYPPKQPPSPPQMDPHTRPFPPGHGPQGDDPYPGQQQVPSYDYRNCDRKFNKEEFEIQTVNFPNNYPNSLNCRYTIHRLSDVICKLELTFVKFDVETSSNCLYDYFSVEGERLCGTIPEDEIRTYDFDKYQKLLYFRSDGASPRMGFKIRARQLRCDITSTPPVPTTSADVTKAPMLPSSQFCDEVYSSEEFTVNSPNHPEEYPNDVTCDYRIHKFADAVCALQIFFVTFDVEQDENCKTDYLDLGDERYCGQEAENTTLTLPFDEAEKIITFHSDRSTSRTGFSIRVRQMTECPTTWQPATPPPPLCDFCIRDIRGHFTSTNFPKNYNNLQHCSFHLEKVKGYCAVEIYFHAFDLEEAPSCNKDYLLLQRKRYCGQELRHRLRKVVFPDTLPAEINLFFHSDGDTTAPGFHVEFRQVECYSNPWRMRRGNHDSSYWPKPVYVARGNITELDHHTHPTSESSAPRHVIVHRPPKLLSFYTVSSDITVRRPDSSNRGSG